VLAHHLKPSLDVPHTSFRTITGVVVEGENKRNEQTWLDHRGRKSSLLPVELLLESHWCR
jgi:hypothetical protein